MVFHLFFMVSQIIKNDIVQRQKTHQYDMLRCLFHKSLQHMQVIRTLFLTINVMFIFCHKEPFLIEVIFRYT